MWARIRATWGNLEGPGGVLPAAAARGAGPRPRPRPGCLSRTGGFQRDAVGAACLLVPVSHWSVKIFPFRSSILNVERFEIHLCWRGPAAGHKRASSGVSEAGGGGVAAPVGQADCHGPPHRGLRTAASPAAGAGPGREGAGRGREGAGPRREGAPTCRICHLKSAQDVDLGDCLALESASETGGNMETDSGRDHAGR